MVVPIWAMDRTLLPASANMVMPNTIQRLRHLCQVGGGCAGQAQLVGHGRGRANPLPQSTTVVGGRFRPQHDVDGGESF
jgi:hypothetical protein